jgi:hypothetical protein
VAPGETDTDLEQQALAEGLTDAPTNGHGRRDTPPHDDQAEQAVLGAALITHDALTAARNTGLAPHHFYRPSHTHIWTALCELDTPDAILVAGWLTDHHLDIGGASTLLQLAADAPGTLNAGHYAQRVRHQHQLRAWISAGTELAAAARADNTDHIARILERLDHQALPDTTVEAGSLVDWTTLFDRSLDDDWLLEPLIATARGHALYAGQKAGKSLLLASVLVPAAMGLPVLERRSTTPLRTLYLDFEMTREDVAERIEAMGFGHHNAADLEPLAYHVLPAIPPLDTAAGGQTVLAWARNHGAQLVVFDTMARAVAGAENDADTYRDYYRHTGALLKAEGIATFRLDHSGKEQDRGQRGSSAKADDVDVVWKLTARGANQFTLEATHRRMGWIPHRIELARRPDPLAYTQVTATWPAGTKAVADTLDELAAPLDITRKAARALLKQAGRTAATDALAAALKYRREDPERCPDTPTDSHLMPNKDRTQDNDDL